jgi:biotin carboxylase
VVVKPRRGSASQGVRVVGGPAEAEALTVDRPSVAQVFLPDQTYHVDGVFDGERLAVWRASRYVNDCLSFTTGAPLGSVELDDPRLLAPLGAFAERALAALSGDVYAFHLELFVDDPGEGAEPVITFLEVGRRVGGAEIPFLWREVHGIDLLAVEWALESGLAPELPSPPPPGRVGGWLLMPLPAGMSRPCRITSVEYGAGADGPYARRVPAVGDVIPAADAYYEHVGGRFRFQGGTTAEVEAAIRATAEGFALRAEALSQPVGTP